MVGSIREILGIHTPQALDQAFCQFEAELTEALEPIQRELDKNLMSGEIIDQMEHMCWIESWRDRTVRYLYLTTGFVEHAKSDQFTLPYEKGVTDAVRDAHKKSLAGPFVSMQGRLEGLIDSIDSRVNLCKKTLNIEGDGERIRRRVTHN
jgi:hypothetical protein